MLLFTNWLGSFLVENGQITDKRLFPKDAREIARRLAAVQDFEVLPEEQELARDREGLEVSEKRLAKLGNYIRQPVRFVAPEDHGFEGKLLHEAMLIVARERARAAVGPDVHLIHAIDALDELAKQHNYQLERLREWHGAHFPEFSGLVGDERYLAMLCEGPERERLSTELGLEGESLGAEASAEDLAAIKELAIAASGTMNARKSTEEYIRSRARQLAPNTSDLVGELLAARLIALAGGMERLARMPSSTVQVLGAEKAFFKHIKTGARPPKHGAIFQHPLVHRALYWQRGKVARAMAGKISIAAKVDFYRGKADGADPNVGKDLALIVEARAKAVGHQFPEAPKKMRIIRQENRGGGRHESRRGDRYGGRGGRDRGGREGGPRYPGGGSARRAGDGHRGVSWREDRGRSEHHPIGKSEGHPDWQKGRRMNKRR